MGRAFEFRKARKFKRWGNMARVFTKLGKEITIAAKQGGPEPENNPRLRVLMQNAKKENMPKENVERAIKRAVSKDFTDYKEMNYEGYGPFGIAIFVDTATDNTTRTVANVRSYFNKNGGSLGTSGSLEFLFDHKCVFHIAKKEDLSLEDLELELIDFGVDEVEESFASAKWRKLTRSAVAPLPTKSNDFVGAPVGNTPQEWGRKPFWGERQQKNGGNT